MNKLHQIFNSASTRLCLALITLLTLSHINGVLVHNLDDLSVLRASAYLDSTDADTMREKLREHLELSAPALTNQQYERYLTRLTYPGNYSAQNYLVKLFERLPLRSPYQSVFFALWVIHVLAIVSLFYTLRWMSRGQPDILIFAFLASLVPIAVLPFLPGSLSPFPFQSPDHHWFVPAPRGATMTFFFAAFLVLNAAKPAGHTRGKVDPRQAMDWKRWSIAALLIAGSFLSHRSMAILLIVPTSTISVLLAVTGKPYHVFIRKIGLWRFMCLLNAAWVAVATAKFGALSYFQAHGTPLRVTLLALIICFWIVSSSMLIYSWWKYRLATTRPPSSLIAAGDFFATYLIPFSVFGIGFNMFQPETPLGAWFIPFEAGIRLLGLTQVLWWMLLGILLYQKQVFPLSKRQLAKTSPLLVAILFLGMFATLFRSAGNHNDLFREELLSTKVSSLLALPPEEAYADEVLYFQAVANELREKQGP